MLEMIVSAGHGHVGGSLSCTDILVSLYHGAGLRFDHQNPEWDERDRLIFSKGHSVEALYAVLADVGFFEVEELASYGRSGSRLGGHADGAVPGVEVSTGSLGHGLGIGAGLALAAKLDRRDHMTVVIMGDGECYEGSVWEAAMFASHQKLNNLVAVVDRNGQITLDYTEECNQLEPFADKWAAFGWETCVVNGHSFEELSNAFQHMKDRRSQRPLVVIANTIKARGISGMEGDLNWHHNVPSGELLDAARRELAFHGE